MVNEHQPHGQAIIHGDGLMFGKWQPTGGLTGLLCSLAYELAATWFSNFHSEGPKWTFAYSFTPSRLVQ